ncbi:MAG: energy transducer TonB, partial [Sphingobacteriaceae bacterium]
GYYLSFDKKDRREGSILNGRRDGVWKGMFYDDASFTETYSSGRLISGAFTGPDKKTYTYNTSEQIPEFPGGLAAMGKFLGSNLRYPARARENKVQGRVLITFIVHSDGTLMDIHVKRGVDPELDNEALRVVKKFPRWKPGIQNSRPVRIQYTIPVAFNLAIDNY